MKKTTIIFFFSLLFPLVSMAQKFPDLPGKTLDGEEIMLPEAASGKYTLIGMSYSKKSEEFLRTWYDPVIDKFIIKRGMFDALYDVNIYFVPMFTGVKKASFEKAFKEVKQRTDKQLYAYVLFYKGELKRYRETLKMTEKDLPYFFLIDANGIIVTTFKGKFKDEYFEEIEEILVR
mgnify:CR=1 FL=1